MVDIVEMLVESAQRERSNNRRSYRYEPVDDFAWKRGHATARSSVISSDAELSICLRTVKLISRLTMSSWRQIRCETTIWRVIPNVRFRDIGP